MDREVLELLKSMQNDIRGINDKVTNLSEGQDNLRSEVQKNSIKLESIEKKVDVIGLAVKNTSKDMKELKDKFDKVEKVTIQNTYDVAYLKSAK